MHKISSLQNKNKITDKKWDFEVRFIALKALNFFCLLEYNLEESHIRSLLQSTGNSGHYQRSSDQGIITKLPLTVDNDDLLRRHQADDPDMHQIIIKPDHLLTIDGVQAICCCG